ncbi:MAG: HAD hydrolase family protein [Candidatus Cloacimonetes bacterium]|nr:HAD hydrolase family protein [Candidatus Cloacimonadota bacterium]
MDFNKIKLLILDNDGVLTDGSIILNNERVESKNYNAKDGLGVRLLSFSDIKLAIITGRSSEVVKKRCEELDIELLFQGVRNKFQKTLELISELGIDWENIAYLGDDWNDYPVMEKCGISAVPADAFDDFKQKADIVLDRKGGKGAVREIIELILKKQGKYDKSLQRFLAHLKSQ